MEAMAESEKAQIGRKIVGLMSNSSPSMLFVESNILYLKFHCHGRSMPNHQWSITYSPSLEKSARGATEVLCNC